MPQIFGSSNNRSKAHSHIQFITTPTADTPGTALLLHFDDKRYLVGNIHEGLQRAGLQVGARFFKAKDFFLTGKTEWQSNGGLLGMILTLADASKSSTISKAENARNKTERRLAREEEARKNSKKRARLDRSDHSDVAAKSREMHVAQEDPNITLHGGPNLTHTIATARSFIFRHGTPVTVIENQNEKETSGEERDWKPTWEDNRVQMWAMAITPSGHDAESSAKSPRKRSLGDYINGQSPITAIADDQWSTRPASVPDEEKRNQQIREFVVSEMFNSNWRYDNLVETPLSDVVMPAGLFTRDPRTKKIMKYFGPTPDGTNPVPNINVLVRQPWPGALVDHLPATKPSMTAMSYIFRNHMQRGKFKPDAAIALKVPPGPLWSKLANGTEVESSDGKTVTPDMVLEPSKDGNGIAVVDLPSREYIPDLVDRPEWKVEKIMAGVGAIVWILGSGVANDQKLRDFMNSNKNLKHIISSSDHSPNYLVQTSAATAAIHQNQIDPTRFPIPIHSNATSETTAPSRHETADHIGGLSQDVLSAKRGLRIDLEPAFGITEDDVVPYLNTVVIVQETPEKVIKFAQTAQQEIQSKVSQMETANQGLPSPDAEIICLGTGSALPSPFRNVSGTLLRVPGHGSYLLDCGENTLGQLKRIFTPSELAHVFHDLKLIWISHLHADHHLGITSVIKAWYEEVHGKDPSKRARLPLTEQLLDPSRFLEDGKRLFIAAHGHMMRWLEEYSSVEDFGYNQLVPLTSFPTHWKQPDRSNLEWNGLNVGFNTARDPRVRSAIRKATSLSNLVAVPVTHCYGAQAVSLTFPNGFKFSYSGDCRPSKEFAIIGKGSTVLLHEATFDDELSGDAEAKKHSTTSEAIGVGVAMGAKRVLLTHFSQRYQKIPSMGSMDSLNVRLEAAEDVDDPMEGMEPPVNAEDQPSIQTPSNSSSQHSRDAKGKDRAVESTYPSSHNTRDLDPTFASLKSMTDLIQPPTDSMRIGVAFDYMRVKVGDIMHLDKFTPALRELYKETEKEEMDEKMKKTQGEAFADNEQDPTQSTRKDDQGTPVEGQPSKKKQAKKEKRELHRAMMQRQKEQEKLDAQSSIADKDIVPVPAPAQE